MIYIELFISFTIIGFSSFGGLSMVPLINDQMTSHGWMTLQELADILAIAEMTPGPLGLNCATFAGARTAGVPGAVIATIGVLMPALSVCMAAAVCLERFKRSTVMKKAMYGIRPVCIGITGAVIVEQSMTNYFTHGAGIEWISVFIGCVAFFMIFYRKWSVPKTVMLSAALGLTLGCLAR